MPPTGSTMACAPNSRDARYHCADQAGSGFMLPPLSFLIMGKGFSRKKRPCILRSVMSLIIFLQKIVKLSPNEPGFDQF